MFEAGIPREQIWQVILADTLGPFYQPEHPGAA